MIEYERIVKDQIFEALENSQKVVILYGPRQVGKTTLSKQLLCEYDSVGYFNCEEIGVQSALSSFDSFQMHQFFGKYSLVVLDEAQVVQNIGKALKILIDAYPEMKIIATGSSSFELANKVNEPLTGRKIEFFLSGISFAEQVESSSLMDATSSLDLQLVYGCYPEIISSNSLDKKRETLQSLATSYLYRDVLIYHNIKKPDLLMKILRALALQVGNEVSYNEIASLLQIDRKTVISYIDLLEQAFVIFKLHPYFTNGRTELKKKPKIYFYDNGILNALLQNFLPISNRNDVGALWENYLVSQRLVQNKYNRRYRNTYFWRNLSRQEVDYVEEFDGSLHPYEFKYNNTKASKGSYAFVNSYHSRDLEIINKDNYFNWLLSN